MRKYQNPLLIALAVAAVALALLAVPLLFEPGDGPSSQEPRSRIVATTEGTQKVPSVGDERSDEIDGSIDVFLERLYALAFVDLRPSEDDPDATEELELYLRRLAPLFSQEALGALRGDPRVFDLSGLWVTGGRLAFEGVVTLADTDAPQALVEIDLVAEAVAEHGPSPRAVIRQSGTFRLRGEGTSWRVEAFDLRLEVTEVPELSPDAEADDG